MPTLRVDDNSVPPDARTFAGDLRALGSDYEIQITLQESEWIPHAWEHIAVFIQAPLGVAATAALLNQLVGFFLARAKEQGLKRPAQDQRKLTIYGPDTEPLKVIVVKGDRVEEE